MNVRNVIIDDAFAQERIQAQFRTLNFRDTSVCPLINGGCGKGKTTALFSPAVFEILTERFGRPPRILITESRSLTRDQTATTNTNPYITVEQYQRTSQHLAAINSDYDIIVIDEAHSLFSDAEFAATTTAPICEWLRESCTIYQIYITASDEEFLSYCNAFHLEKTFDLTYPDMDEMNVRYLAQKMILSINSVKTAQVIARKERTFFAPGQRGVFFVLSAKEAYQLYEYYTAQGYRCGFYISQQNNSQLTSPLDNEEEDFLSYTSTTLTVHIPQAYEYMENLRANTGKEKISDSLRAGKLPKDVDYLFITDVGQEGVSLNSENNLSFVFIEDTYPLKINQKLFRYRANIPLAYISLPQRRLQAMLVKTIEKLTDMMTWSQEKLEGYYLGSNEGKKVKDTYARLIWHDPKDGKYKVAENYMAYALVSARTFRSVRDAVRDKDDIKLKETYGLLAADFVIEDSKKESVRERIEILMRERIGQSLTKEEIQNLILECKKAGLIDESRKQDFKFPYLKKYCEENGICNFISKQKRIDGSRVRVYEVQLIPQNLSQNWPQMLYIS